MRLAYFRSPVGWLELARRTVRDTMRDGCFGLAAQLAFYFFLAVFPALLLMVSLLALLPIDARAALALERLSTVLPSDGLAIVREQLTRVLQGPPGGVLTLAVAGALWSSSSAMTAIIDTLNHAYDIEERRPWWKTRLLAIGLTIAIAVLILVAFILVVGGGDLARWLAASIGAGDTFASVWTVVQSTVALALVVAALELIYYAAPNAESEWSWLTPGAVLACGLWVCASLGFKLYVRQFADFGAVYGSIGGIIVLLLWFYLTGLAILVGAELNAEIEKALPERDRAARSEGRPRRLGPVAERAARRPPEPAGGIADAPRLSHGPPSRVGE
jgi:membrane protein